MSENGRTVGVLGGMGPEATVDFMAKVIAATPAKRDQDHVHMLIDHNPAVPDRQQAIVANGADPGPVMAAMAKRLEAAGADFLVIPCNAAHAFQAQVKQAVGIPLLSIIDATVAACREHGPVGVLATEACLRSELYQQAFAKIGVATILQNDGELAKLMRLVYRIKSGDQAGEIGAAIRDLADDLVSRGAKSIIAGCTEIPLVLHASMLKVPLFSSTDILAAQTVALARGEIPFPEKEQLGA